MNKENKVLHLYPRLLSYITPYKVVIALTVVVLVGLAVLEPVKANMFKLLLDEALINQNPDYFVLVPVMISGLFIALGILEYCSRVASQWLSQKATTYIRIDMFAKLHQLPVSMHHAYGTGNMMSKITYDVTMASAALSNAWIVIIRDALTIMALLAYMLYISWQLSFMLLVIVPINIFLINRASKKIRSASQHIQKHMGQMTENLEQGIRGHRDIKIYNAEDYENRSFNVIVNDLFSKNMRVARVSALTVPLVQVLSALALSAVIYVAIQMVSRDFFTPGELVAYITAMALTFAPVKRITNINETIQKGMAAAESIFELLDQKNEEDKGRQVLSNSPGDIVFNKTNFFYPDIEEPVLRDLSLRIPANQTTALVGQSGSGKTTIVNLIARFYTLPDNQLMIGEHDINALALKSLREKMAFVSQHIVLLNDTVASNIAYGDDSPDLAAIKAAAIKAHAWEFIERLPDGLKTNVGSDGSSLSGGQRQRLSLARAFYKQAPILILDEATSALDNQSEKEIQAAMEEMKGQQTIIIIAHRLSSIEHADQIVVLEKGQVKEVGTHHSLLEQDGIYKKLQGMD